MNTFWERLAALFKRKPDNPQPPTPAPPAPERTPYLRIWALLSKINIRELWPALLSIPVLLFFAISGVLAWAVVLLRFLVNIWRTVS